MGEVSEQVLSFLAGKSPAEIRKILSQLAEAAGVAEQERAGQVEQQRAELEREDPETLRGRLERMQALPGHARDMREYDRVLKAYQSAVKATQPAVQPEVDLSALQAKSNRLTQVRQEIKAWQSDPAPTYRKNLSKYSKLVDEASQLEKELRG